MDSGQALSSVTGGELLAELPAEWIDQLSDAVLNGEKDLLDRLIRLVGQQHAQAARTLQEAADRYEYDVLARWFEEAAQAGTARLVEQT